MDDDKARQLLEALGLTLAVIAARRLADPPATQVDAAVAQASDEAEAAAALAAVHAVLSAGAAKALEAQARSDRRRMAADARRHGADVPADVAEPSAQVRREGFGDVLDPLRDLNSIYIERKDTGGTVWEPYGDALRAMVAEATGDPAMGTAQALQRRIAGVAKVAAEDGWRIRAGRSGRLEPTGYLRMRLFDAMGQAADRERTRMADLCGMDAVEVSMHDHCADDHIRYQGRKYTLREFNRINGGLERPIGRHVMNCRHIAFPCYSDDEPAYTAEEREDVNRQSTRRVHYRDARGSVRECTAYEATQLQRRQEARIRNVRHEAKVLREGGVEESARRLDATADALTERYDRFCDQVGIPADHRRTQVYTIGRGGHVAATRAPASKPSSLKRGTRRTKAERQRDERAADLEHNKIRAASQRKHIPGTKEYEEKVAALRKGGGPYTEPSAFTIGLDEIQALVDRYAGTGTPEVTASGEWRGTERCDVGRVIGYVVMRDGTRRDASWIKIHYGKNGTHAVPFRPTEEK